MLKLNNKRSSVLAVSILAAWAIAAQAADVVRVSPLVYERGRLDPDTTDLVIAQLASGAGVEVVERAQMELIFSDWAQTAFRVDEEKRIRLGALFEVDYFVFVTKGRLDAHGVLEIVAGRTGELAHTQAIAAGPSPLGLATGVKRAVENFLKQPGRHRRMGSGLLAFTEPVVHAATDDVRSRVGPFLAEVKKQLQVLAVPVLHRTYERAVVEEVMRRERGFLRSNAVPGAFLGAVTS